MPPTTPFSVYSTAGYRFLQDRLFEANRQRPGGDQLPLVPGLFETELFADEERYYRYKQNLVGRRVLILGGSPNADELVQLITMAMGAYQQGAREILVVDAYFGYSTMERAVKRGEIVTARIQAELKSTVPQAPDGTWWYNFDLHSEGLPGFYRIQMHTEHWYCQGPLSEAIESLGLDNYVMGSTDLGRASWIKTYAAKHNVDIVLIDKRRDKSQTSVDRVIGVENLPGRDVVLFDDMFRTCGSVIKATDTYVTNGARNIYLIGTHGLFVGNSYKKLQDSGRFKEIVCMDTHPNALRHERAGLKVRSVAPLILDNLARREKIDEVYE